MYKCLGAIAGAAALVALAAPAPVNAQERAAPGIHKQQAGSVELSARKRKFRRHPRVVIRPHWQPRHYSYWNDPYYGAYAYPYGYRTYPYGYYSPGPHVSIGPRGFRFGFW
jgi:hypothetical protein